MKEEDYYIVKATYNSEWQGYNETAMADTLEEAKELAQEMLQDHAGKRKRRCNTNDPDDVKRPIVAVDIHKEWAEDDEWWSGWYYSKFKD